MFAADAAASSYIPRGAGPCAMDTACACASRRGTRVSITFGRAVPTKSTDPRVVANFPERATAAQARFVGGNRPAPPLRPGDAAPGQNRGYGQWPDELVSTAARQRRANTRAGPAALAANAVPYVSGSKRSCSCWHSGSLCDYPGAPLGKATVPHRASLAIVSAVTPPFVLGGRIP